VERTNKPAGEFLASNPAPRAGERTSASQSDFKAPFRRRRAGVRSDLTLIKGILSKALAGKGIDKKIERYEFVLHWDKIVGTKLAEVSKPEYISRKTLIVRVLHPVWAQECAFMKTSLLRKLAPYLKRGDVVEDMIFRVGPLQE
jgi:predicted nucleic acid-binding Zn ribbon protein